MIHRKGHKVNLRLQASKARKLGAKETQHWVRSKARHQEASHQEQQEASHQEDLKQRRGAASPEI